MVPFSTKVE